MTRKLNDVALSEQVYLALRGDIIAGHYQPGEKITISSLAEQFGVSSTPVREAIRLLLAEGGLDLRPNHSVTVVALSSERYREVATIRMELEGLAAATAAQCRTEKQLSHFSMINEKLESARLKGKFGEVLKRNRELHFSLAEMARMPVLSQVLEGLWLRSGPLLNVLYQYSYSQPIKDHPHNELLAALVAGNPEKARKAIQRDIRQGTKIITQHIESVENSTK